MPNFLCPAEIRESTEMKCLECEHIEPITFDRTAFWIYPPTSEATSDLVARLTVPGFDTRKLDGNALVVTVNRDRIADVLSHFEAILKGPELSHAKVLTTAGQEPRSEDIGRTMQLDTFINRYQSGWIVESIEKDRFETWFQPIVDAKAPNPDRPFAREGLFRMSDAQGNIVPPGKVFGIAGTSELLFTLDLVARRSAVESAARAKIDSKIFINFNPSSIYDPAYCLRTTAAAIRELGMQPADIVFELTETHRARDAEHLKGILSFYRNAGFGVALDDIGSGWSGLNMLHEYKPDYVKIDMDLVRGVDTDSFKQTIVGHLISIARELGIVTIGEGVETQAEGAWMTGAGVDYLQGYLYGKPAPLAPRASVSEQAQIQKATERFTARVGDPTLVEAGD